MRKFEAREAVGIRTLAGICLVLLLPFVMDPAQAQSDPAESSDAASATVSWDFVDAVTTLAFNTETLSALGVETTAVGSRVSGHVRHSLSIIPDGAPSFSAVESVGLRSVIGWDGFRGFEGGTIRHRGGFILRRGGSTLDFSDLELRVGTKAAELELVDARGVAYLATAAAQWKLDAGAQKLSYMNADFRVLPAFAEWLGDARYADMTLGVLDMDANLRGGRAPELPPVPNAPCGDWSGNVDVGLVNMSSVSSAGPPGVVNGRSVTVVLPSAELENVGTANVPWYSQFTNLGVPPHNDQHPYLVWQMLRSSNGVLEPIGRNDLKHGFLTINSGCDAGACTDSHVLGLGCADVYGTGTNNSLGRLGFRSEITASTGVWAHCGGIPTHFDADGNCAQDSGFTVGENSFTHGLKAAETDLQVAGALYYVEAFYVVKDDINIFNSMGYRRVTPAKPSTTWTFATVGAYTQGPAMNAWVNLTTPGPGADNRVLDTGQGRVQLAVRVSDVTGSPGMHRFAYALQNHDFDRRISSFNIPFDATVGVVQNIAYADGDGFAANDWTAVADATGITWTAPVGTTPPAPIDYATLVSFRFDSDLAATTPATATLGVFEAGSPTDLTLTTLAPSGSAPVYGYYTVNPCRLLDTRVVGGAIAHGEARLLDVAATGCGVPTGAKSIAVNVTAVGSTSGGEIALSAGATSAAAATVRFAAGTTRANNAVVRLTADGKMNITPALQAAGSTHVVIDVLGYFDLSP